MVFGIPELSGFPAVGSDLKTIPLDPSPGVKARLLTSPITASVKYFMELGCRTLVQLPTTNEAMGLQCCSN